MTRTPRQNFENNDSRSLDQFIEDNRVGLEKLAASDLPANWVAQALLDGEEADKDTQ